MIICTNCSPAPRPRQDDWGWGDVGSLARLVNSGDKKPVTPALDRVAAEGTVFTRFHTLASVCSPSRASCGAPESGRGARKMSRQLRVAKPTKSERGVRSYAQRKNTAMICTPHAFFNENMSS